VVVIQGGCLRPQLSKTYVQTLIREYFWGQHLGRNRTGQKEKLGYDTVLPRASGNPEGILGLRCIFSVVPSKTRRPTFIDTQPPC
jgi:hypothetical protein